MISDTDINFHIPDDMPPTWAETNFFGWSIPEESLFGHVYMLARTGVGVTQGEAVVIGSLTDNRADCLYVDCQPSMPLIESLSRARTANGIEIDALNRRDYNVRYKGFGGMELSLAYRGLMEPFDIHDPNHSPMAAAHPADRAKNSGTGSAFASHFDMTCKVDGVLRIGGREFNIDCVETIDHSWGPRPEVDIPANGWMHAHFGSDLAIHWINRRDLTKTGIPAHRLAHGYVLEAGEVYGLTDLRLDVTRLGDVITGIAAEATDRRGRTFRLHGNTIAGSPLMQYNHMDIYTSLMRWTLDDGRVGHGTAMEGASISERSRISLSRWATLRG